MVTHYRRNRPRTGRCVFPGYRWCGPGCSGPGSPINDVDACCKRHDQCIERYGSSCECDRMFLDCLQSKLDSRTKKGRHARLMYQVIRLRYNLSCNRL